MSSEKLTVEEVQDYYLKLLLLGEPAVGKSSLIVRYIQDRFTEDYKTSLGADFMAKTLVYTGDNDKPKKNVNLQIWDIAGQSKFSAFRKLYYTGVAGVLLVFDITNMMTLEKLAEWNKDVNSFSPNAIKVLIGNKLDLAEKGLREVSDNDRRIYEKMLGTAAVSIETSAKTGAGVHEAFHLIARTVLERTGKLNKVQN
ncbi:MAG: Rab family GTPase [Candidatus Hodarchaeales archaeon]|jgi:small GTP-binding protein